jgi:hypothetical protein
VSDVLAYAQGAGGDERQREVAPAGVNVAVPAREAAAGCLQPGQECVEAGGESLVADDGPLRAPGPVGRLMQRHITRRYLEALSAIVAS